LRGEHAWTYAGAGLVPGSDPAREWEETAVKMAMMREALGA
jgi:isochorismate synthase EntC